MKLNIQKNVNYKQVFFLIIIFLIGITLIYFIVKKLLSHQENPKDRNYISFENANVDEVIGRMHEMKELIGSSRFPHDEALRTYFSYDDGIFKVLDTNKIGELTFNNLRRKKIFENVSDENIKNFIYLFNYLGRQDITPMIYYYSTKQIIFEYKPYYDMYKTWTYDDDLERFIKFKGDFNKNDKEFYKIIDSLNNLYLYTFKSAEIWGDDIKYRKR